MSTATRLAVRQTGSASSTPRRSKRLSSVFETGRAKQSAPSTARRTLAPQVTTDWTSSLYSRAGFPRPLASAPREDALPKLKDAVKALKLHLGPGGRQSYGPLQRPTLLGHAGSNVAKPGLAKEERMRKVDQEIGGDYHAYLPTENGKEATKVAAQAVWRNPTLDVNANRFLLEKVEKSI